MDLVPETDDKLEAEKRQGTARYWLEQIRLASKRETDWRKRGTKIIERYRREKQPASGQKRFNILWANTEILKSAVYARPPRPDVRRRFKKVQQPPENKQAAQILENGLAFLVDDPECDFDAVMQSVRDDMLLPGRGIAWVVYEPSFDRVYGETSPVMAPDPVTGEPVEIGEKTTFNGQEMESDGTEDDTPYVDNLSEQKLYLEYVYWEDYRESPARRAKDVWWRARRHTMDLQELKKAFPELGSQVINIPRTLNRIDEGDKGQVKETFAKAVVWEIWDKSKKRRVWVAEGYQDGPLSIDDDPYSLENFYPCAEPLYAVKTTSSRVPIPEFTLYQDQADELDNLTFRISKLIDACKVRGIYAGIIKEMRNLLNGDDNELFSTDDWAALQAKGGLDGAVTWLPIEQIAKVLLQLGERRDTVKKEIYEITGLSDLSRGDTKASETYGAQQLKANFGNARMSPRRRPMEKFIRDTLRIMGEILAEHFTPENLEAMTGEQVTPQVMQILRSDKARGFVIDIETDSTVEPDATEEKSDTTEFLGAVTQFFGAAGPIMQEAPETAPMFMAMLKSATRVFKGGRQLEDEIDQAADKLAQRAASAPTGPNPMEMEKIKAQIENLRASAAANLAKAGATQVDAHLAQIEAVLNALNTMQTGQETAANNQIDRTGKIIQMMQPQGAA